MLTIISRGVGRPSTMNRYSLLFVLVLWLLQGNCQVLADADSYTVQEKNQLLNGYKFAGLFKVTEVKRLSEEKYDDRFIKVKSKVKLTLTDVIPNSFEKRNFEIVVTIIMSGNSRVVSRDDWFPLDKGSIFLAGFKSEKLEEGKDLYPLIAFEDVEAGFRDCKKFYTIVTSEPKEIPKRLARVVSENMANLTGLYFELISNYDLFANHDGYDSKKSFIANHQKSIFVHHDFVPRLIEYLRSEKVTLPRKANLISRIVVPEALSPEIQRIV